MAAPLPHDNNRIPWLLVQGENARWYMRDGDLLAPESPVLGEPIFRADGSELGWSRAVGNTPDKLVVVRGDTVPPSRPDPRVAYLCATRTTCALDRPVENTRRFLQLVTADFLHEGWGIPWKGPDTWPETYWRAICYPTEGGSEGHYVHVGTLHKETWTSLVQCKVLGDSQRIALEMSLRVNFMLGLV